MDIGDLLESGGRDRPDGYLTRNKAKELTYKTLSLRHVEPLWPVTKRLHGGALSITRGLA